jgi:hypothetical protein
MFLVLLALEVHAEQTRVVLPPPPQTSQPQFGTGAITGPVTDAASDRPIAAAIVTLEERRAGSRVRSYLQLTTAKGRFAFLDLPAADTYVLTIIFWREAVVESAQGHRYTRTSHLWTLPSSARHDGFTFTAGRAS